MASKKSQLIVALDQITAEEIPATVEELAGAGIKWVKVGLELYTKGGPKIVEDLKKRGLRVFLDLKLYDIPNTVARAAKVAADHGVDFLTVHCSGGAAMLAAAQNAVVGSQLSLLGVTVLTSFGGGDFQSVCEAWGLQAGASIPRGTVALSLARLAAASGLPGIVCSVSDLHDGQFAKLPWQASPLFITPGIRGASDSVHDQKAVASVAQAVAAGSTHLVVGRPIMSSDSRIKAAENFLRQIDEAC